MNPKLVIDALVTAAKTAREVAKSPAGQVAIGTAKAVLGYLAARKGNKLGEHVANDGAEQAGKGIGNIIAGRKKH